jgi:hypothetical protein
MQLFMHISTIFEANCSYVVMPFGFKTVGYGRIPLDRRARERYTQGETSFQQRRIYAN